MGRVWAQVWVWTERLLEVVISLCLLAMVTVTVIDVAGRYLFNAPLSGGYEISEILMGLTVFAALPLASRAESHLAIGLLTDGLHGTARRWHRIAILAVSAAGLGYIGWRMSVQAMIVKGSMASTGSLQIPIWPVATAMAVLGWLSCLVTLALLARASAGLDREAHAARGSLE
jgi:TRAP-type C4-dicarboxylate transport system permease small subunit